MDNVPECFYRVSVKALILNETRDKFLVCKKKSGVWELPGGGLDWGMSPQDELAREIDEEMSIKVTKVADHPSYFLTGQTLIRQQWVANVIYEAELEHLNFSPSDECIELKFFSSEEARQVPHLPQVTAFIEQLERVQNAHGAPGY